MIYLIVGIVLAIVGGTFFSIGLYKWQKGKKAERILHYYKTTPIKHEVKEVRFDILKASIATPEYDDIINMKNDARLRAVLIMKHDIANYIELHQVYDSRTMTYHYQARLLLGKTKEE